MTCDTLDYSSPADTEFENDIDNFITLQQQLQHPNTLTIHHLSQRMTSSEPSNSPSTTGETGAHRVFKRKLPDTSFPSNPRPTQSLTNHQLHTNTEEFLQVCSPFFYNVLTIIQILTTNNQITLTKDHYFPLSWTSYIHFSNTKSLPLYKNPDDIELSQTRLHHLTIALHEKRITAIGLNQTLYRFTALKANKFSINQ